MIQSVSFCSFNMTSELRPSHLRRLNDTIFEHIRFCFVVSKFCKSFGKTIEVFVWVVSEVLEI